MGIMSELSCLQGLLAMFGTNQACALQPSSELELTTYFYNGLLAVCLARLKVVGEPGLPSLHHCAL